jgi:hypothetical protein
VVNLEDLCCRWPVFAGECVNADVCKELVRQHVGPGSRAHILTVNLSVSGFSACLHHQNHPATVSGIPDSSALAAIFARLEFVGLLYLQSFAAKPPGCASRQSGHPTSIYHWGIGPASSGIHLQDLLLILPLLSCAKKNKV